MQVSVFNTVGSNESVIQFNGSTKAELCAELAAAGISFKDMSMTIGETQVTLDSAQAATPTLAFLQTMNPPLDSWTLFLLPIEVKSGVESEFMGDFEEEEDNDYGYNVPELSVYDVSAETQARINELEAAINTLQTVIASLKRDVITDPHILARQRQAALLIANMRNK